MAIFNIHEAKSKFSMLIKETLRGEEVIIAKGGTPVARVIPYSENLPERKGGQYKDIMQIPEDFDEPLPKEMLDSFYNKDI